MPDLSKITCIEDLRVIAQRRVPRMFYDYADSGAWTEGTYRANESDFQKIMLRQRVAVNMEGRSTRSTMIGEEVAMPVAIAPTGMTGMQHADGEILGARAAKAFGIPFTLSTMSICSLEDIAEHTDRHPFWFQLYVMKDRDFIERLIERARAANVSALQLTLDLQILGQRHKDIKNGLTAPPKPTLKNLINLATKPQLVHGHAGHEAAQLRQHRGPREERGRPVVAVVVDGGAVRPGAELGRRGVDQEALGRQADPEGHHGRRGRAARGGQRRRRADRVEPRRAPARRRALLDRGAAGDRRGGGHRDRGLDGRRHPQRPGRAQGTRTGRARHA